MDVALRRKVQLLNLALQSGKVAIRPTWKVRDLSVTQDDVRLREGKLVQIDDVGSSILFELPENNVSVALRFVRDVWREDSTWTIWLAGSLYRKAGTKCWFSPLDLEDSSALG